MFMVFDLLQQDDVDLRRLALSDRKRDLDRLCRKSKVPYLRQVETFPDGAVLFDYCSKFGFEGASSQRKDLRYSSGRRATGSRRSALGGRAPTPSAIAFLDVHASPS